MNLLGGRAQAAPILEPDGRGCDVSHPNRKLAVARDLGRHAEGNDQCILAGDRIEIRFDGTVSANVRF
jgi:hypothetical protein